MSQRIRHIRALAAFALAGAALLAWPAVAAAQTVSGAASAVQATVFGTSTVLAGTGPLVDALDAREASDMASSILWLGGADVLHATAISSVDEVASEASLADLGVGVAGNYVSAAFVMASALAPIDGSPAGMSEIDGLAINGVPVYVTGEPNQTVWLLGGRVIINEQTPTSTGTTVNALHVIADGIADLVFGSASGGVSSGGSTTPPPLPPPPPLPGLF